MNKDLPPAVTKNSSKSQLWEELKCDRDEIEQQQRILNATTKRAEVVVDNANVMNYQLSIIRAVLAGGIR